jgi:hypothetical protein
MSEEDTMPEVFDAHEVLVKAFNIITNEIPYDEEFNNGTGYFDHLVHHDTGLKVGDRFKMLTPMPNNRKIVGIVTPVGNVVFFERMTGGDGGIITKNVPSCIDSLWVTGSVSGECIWTALGSAEGYNRNIGHVLDRVMNSVQSSTKNLVE